MRFPPAPRGRCGRTAALPAASRGGASPAAEAASAIANPEDVPWQLEREPRLTRWLRRGSGIMAHLVALGFTIFLTVLSRPGTSLFSWHPVFMALAFCLCTSEAILLFSPEHSVFFFCSRKARIRLHWAGQTLAILCAALGLGFIISSRTRTRVSRVARLKLYHLTCGLVIYLMATVTVLLGMHSVWFQAQIKGAAWYMCLALPLHPALVIMHQISSFYLPRKKMEM
ncbi:hypothetical protein J1605_008010 [Eschrichtius robustus]|uniref:ascorbate ferrireductase (transmembrane) n=1 Tax=Eschrichtius robustus TaxID=9764 RepID=A0AB34GYW2_ESCRO|nr:hypothetical protein J1605_008010 [Eschrichtius robustus]